MYAYLSDDATEYAAQQFGITPPAHVWLKVDLDSASYDVLEHAPELKFLADFDTYLHNNYSGNYDMDLVEYGM